MSASDGDKPVITVEVGPSGTERKGGALVANVREQAAKVLETFDSRHLAAITATINTIRTGLQDVTDVEGVQVEFGLKLTGGANATIVTAGAEANFTVRLTLKKAVV